METNYPEILDNVVEYLNDNFNQQSGKLSIDSGAEKNGVIRYSDNIAISFWGCGAIVCINHIMYFISEDDGNWFISSNDGNSISTGWIESFAGALTRLQDYLKVNGTPIYYEGTNRICLYTL